MSSLCRLKRRSNRTEQVFETINKWLFSPTFFSDRLHSSNINTSDGKKKVYRQIVRNRSRSNEEKFALMFLSWFFYILSDQSSINRIFLINHKFITSVIDRRKYFVNFSEKNYFCPISHSNFELNSKRRQAHWKTTLINEKIIMLK